MEKSIMFRMNSIIMGLVSLFVFGTAQAAVLTVSDYTDNGDGTVTFALDMQSDAPLYGFQFTIEGTTGSPSGGDAAQAGFTSSGTSTVLGFSFSGASIPAGCGTLVELDLAASSE